MEYEAHERLWLRKEADYYRQKFEEAQSDTQLNDNGTPLQQTTTAVMTADSNLITSSLQTFALVRDGIKLQFSFLI